MQKKKSTTNATRGERELRSNAGRDEGDAVSQRSSRSRIGFGSGIQEKRVVAAEKSSFRRSAVAKQEQSSSGSSKGSKGRRSRSADSLNESKRIRTGASLASSELPKKGKKSSPGRKQSEKIQPRGFGNKDKHSSSEHDLGSQQDVGEGNDGNNEMGRKVRKAIKKKVESALGSAAASAAKGTRTGNKLGKGNISAQDSFRKKNLESKMAQGISKKMKAKTKKAGRKDTQPSMTNLFTDNDSNSSAGAEEEDAGAEPLTGVCLIQKELGKLVEKKYKKHLANAERGMEKIKAKFKMNAKQVSELQGLAQAAMGVKLDFDNFQALFKADVGEFFEELNKQLIQVFDFENINMFVEADG
jgi:hypothetical protein